ncbi:MAG: hypothetical protein J6X49_18910 [Victivallales bacterium]|nr:hypothetical protein [Victivallales bacterium]
MIQSIGNNSFKDNKFDFWTWSAPILQTPEEVVQKVHELKLLGRIIKDIRAIGHFYDIEHSDWYQDIFEAIQQGDDKSLATLEFPCYITIDEPLLIQFEDGDILGIDFSEGSSVRMELNTLPWDIRPGGNRRNFHANQMFKDILGREIGDVFVTSALNPPTFTGSHGMDLDNQISYVHKILFNCQSKKEKHKDTDWKQLTFKAWFDFGYVSLEDNSKTIMLPATRIKKVMEGYLTQSDLDYYISLG